MVHGAQSLLICVLFASASALTFSPVLSRARFPMRAAVVRLDQSVESVPDCVAGAENAVEAEECLLPLAGEILPPSMRYPPGIGPVHTIRHPPIIELLYAPCHSAEDSQCDLKCHNQGSRQARGATGGR